MAKPIGAHCNLACKYCYYLDKQELYPEVKQHVMTDETLERFIQQYIEAQMTPDVLFTWHGGETFMRPLSFYQKVLRLQQYYGAGRNIQNCIQTNGTLITPEWARFLHDNQWLVGVSIDGPQEFHDEYRRNKAGKPSWAKVMHGIDLLNKYDVEWNAMAVVNDYNADYPLDFYRFFRDEIGCKFLQFTPIVSPIPASPKGEELLQERGESATKNTSSNELLDSREQGATKYSSSNELLPFGGGGGGASVSPSQWGNFLCTIFDEWVRRDVGTMFVQLFDATLANWVGVLPGVCSMAERCGHAGVVEWNGDVYSCDHFVFPEHKLGNIHEHTLYELMNSPQQQRFATMKADCLPLQCKECEWLFACHGECPKNRIVDPDTHAIRTDNLGFTPRLNYLCEGYRQFFAHAAPYMDFMKQEVMNGREAGRVMKLREVIGEL